MDKKVKTAIKKLVDNFSERDYGFIVIYRNGVFEVIKKFSNSPINKHVFNDLEAILS